MPDRKFLLCLALTAGLWAQDRGSITGTISDPSGSPVVDARVEARSVTRNTIFEARTTAAGSYLVQFLPPDRYVLTAVKEGFRKFTREGLTITATDRLDVDIQLELGAVAESITVTGEAAQIQTESATRIATIQNRFVDNVPTSGRNLYQFQYTLPGVYKASNYWGDFELYAFGNINGVSINGGRRGENETLIDGIPTALSDRGVAYVPALQSVQEVSIISNTYDAQYGRIGGGITTINLKSGTNSLHGQLFHFFENDKLYSGSWDSNAVGRGRTPFRQNVPGFELDGPVYIPKLIDARNKLFFMISLEALRERNPNLQVRKMPTAAELTGDFSDLKNRTGEAMTIYDPFTKQPFAGNRIPAARINPVAAKVGSFYPKPNANPLTADNDGNYVQVTASRNGYDSWNGKMDYRPTARFGYSFRYAQTPWTNFSRVVWGTNQAEPSGEYPSTRTSRTWAADMIYTVSPTMVFNLRAGLARFEGFGGNTFADGFDPRQLGFSDRLVAQFTAVQFPRFNMGSYSEIGATRTRSFNADDNYSLTPAMTWIHNKHQLKYGGDFRRYNRTNLNPGSASGSYDFSRAWTARDPQRLDALSGNEFASFLLGYPSGGFVDRNADLAYRNHYFGLFLQDDWKIARTVTLNLGLRWDYETPFTERYNRMIRGFAFDQASPIASRVQGLNLRGGLQFAGSSGDERRAFVGDRNNFQPRVGIAWQFRPGWVMRAGYGLSYLGQSAAGSSAGFSRPTPLIASTDNGLTPAVTLNDPFPSSLYSSGLLQPIGSSQGLATNLGQGIGAQWLNRPLPSSHQLSFGFQRELPMGFLVDASYSANFTRQIPVGMALNFIPLQELTRLPVAERAAYFNQQVPNPMAGLLPGSAFNGATIPRQQLLSAYPHFANVSISDVPIGSTRYDSLQMKATRRFSGGLAMQVAFTVSKSTEKVNLLNGQDVGLGNLLDTRLEKRLIEFDTPQNLTVVTSYELPFGNGRRWGSSWHGVLNGFAGGWNTNFQYVYRSGLLFDFPTAAPLAARTARLNHGQRDELARKAGRSQFDPLYDLFYDTSLFPRQRQAPFTLRDFPTRFADVRSKALNVWEISISKDFPITERIRFQLRADAQNATNIPWFSRISSSDVVNARFGLLNPSPRTEPREIILAAKVIF
ncbi:MAG: TonB-dependent receptor domain-containing protein [Bryobacteraceae bacterium]